MNTDLRICCKIPLGCSEENFSATGIALPRDIHSELFATCEFSDPKTLFENSSVRTQIKANDRFFSSELRP